MLILKEAYIVPLHLSKGYTKRINAFILNERFDFLSKRESEYLNSTFGLNDEKIILSRNPKKINPEKNKF